MASHQHAIAAGDVKEKLQQKIMQSSPWPAPRKKRKKKHKTTPPPRRRRVRRANRAAPPRRRALQVLSTTPEHPTSPERKRTPRARP